MYILKSQGKNASKTRIVDSLQEVRLYDFDINDDCDVCMRIGQVASP